MALKDIFKKKRNITYVVLFVLLIIALFWAFIGASIMTKSFKDKLINQTYKNKEANIENLLVTETKEGVKLWEMYADNGRYSDIDNMVFLTDIIGNFYEDKKVKASFRADNGTYNSITKEIVLTNNVFLIYHNGANVKADRIEYAGKESDIIAQGNVRIEKPYEGIVMGAKAILKGDFSDFHIEGRTKTQFYM